MRREPAPRGEFLTAKSGREFLEIDIRSSSVSQHGLPTQSQLYPVGCRIWYRRVMRDCAGIVVVTLFYRRLRGFLDIGDGGETAGLIPVFSRNILKESVCLSFYRNHLPSVYS